MRWWQHRNLVRDDDQRGAEIAKFHVGDFADDVLTSTYLVQQCHHFGARVDAILQAAAICNDLNSISTINKNQRAFSLKNVCALLCV